ncbi:MAG: insulinase family protein [Lewinellaceae bacterium]|nr:insulinase family protein [Lewinella sp.]MCB9278567.1 insulinase family protein [Lewinellaceae bacterium]
MLKRFTLLTLLCAALAAPVFSQSEMYFKPDDIDIPYQKFILPNGLTLVVHEDHKAPIAAVNVWYHVGSKNEKPGKSGFAHLFEHLMFNGSEHFNDDYFQVLERIGGTDLNGTTNTDRTNYFQNVPLASLDQVLWLESDRMGHLLGAIDQAKLDEQRGVVQNEKRQGDNQPYSKQFDLMTKAMFPKGHPYSWTTIGEMEDLNAASLEDVHQWFKSYYGAANAVLVIAGDVKAEEIYKKVVRYFGDIPSGPTIVRPEVNIPVRTADTREEYQDRVPEARVAMFWNVPEWGTPEAVYLDLASDILSVGKNSRLYKRLVYEDQIASSANAYVSIKEIAGNFIVQANVKPGQDVGKVESVLIEELQKFLKDGPTDNELYRAKSQYFANFIKGLERIGGFGGKSDILAQNEVYGGSPDYYKKILNTISKATPEDIRKAAAKWLSQGKHTITCTPFPDYSVTASDVDRDKGLPEMGEPVESKFPDLQHATLKNGMKVVLARRPGVPTVVMNMVFDAGTATDQSAKPGTASLAMNMLDEGTKSRTGLEISEELQILGAGIGASAGRDASFISLNTLKPTLDKSLDLYADVALNPAFPQSEFDRLKNETLAQIKREKSSPVQMAFRTLPQFLYGEGHPYSTPGSGYEETVQAMTREDLVKYYNDWLKPNNATLAVVGDLTMDELLPKLEARFGKWQKGKVPAKNIAKVDEAENKGKLFLMDRPESPQSVVVGAYLVEPYGQIPEIAREAMIDVFGGQFTSRINMNLREDKHWAYGAYSFIQNAKGQRPLVAYAQVQTDKTKESIDEFTKEFQQIVGNKPVTEAEFEKTTQNTVLQLPGQWETNNAVLGSLVNMVQYDLPEDYYKTYDQKVRELKLGDVQNMAKKLVHPDQLSFMVVGDKEKVMPELEKLGLEIILIDANGKPIPKLGKAKP